MNTILVIIVLYFVWPSSGAPTSEELTFKEGNGADGIEIEYLHIHADIRFRYARTRIMSQLWNPGKKSQETRFWITIPKDAFITDFILELSSIRQFGHSKLKNVAGKFYCQLKASGELVGLIKLAKGAGGTQSAINKYEMVINLRPQQRVNLTLAYEGHVDKIAGGGNSIKYELDVQVTPENMKAVAKFQTIVNIQESGKVDQPFIPPLRTVDALKIIHPNFSIQQYGTEKGLRITFDPSPEETRELADEDLLGRVKIIYGVKPNSEDNEILVRDGYLVHLDSSNLRINVEEPLPKHIIFVLDVSGSMYGKRLKQLKAGMANILNSMKQTYNHHNFIDIVTFSNVVSTWEPILNKEELTPLSLDNKNLALKFINDLTVDGSTNIFAALQKAMTIAQWASSKIPNDGNAYPPTIIFFVTDGEPTSGLINPKEILRRLQVLNKDLQVPIYSLAFGSKADYSLCRNISAQSGGLARKIFEFGDAAIRFQEFYLEITSRDLQGVKFKYVKPIDFVKEVTHATFELHYTEDLKNSNVKFGELSELPKTSTVIVDSTTMDLPCAEKCFMEKLSSLQRISRIHGSFGNHNPSCHHLASQRRHGNISEAIELAFKYEFVTPCTSLVVVGPPEPKLAGRMFRNRIEDCEVY